MHLYSLGLGMYLGGWELYIDIPSTLLATSFLSCYGAMIPPTIGRSYYEFLPGVRDRSLSVHIITLLPRIAAP